MHLSALPLVPEAEGLVNLWRKPSQRGALANRPKPQAEPFSDFPRAVQMPRSPTQRIARRRKPVVTTLRVARGPEASCPGCVAGSDMHEVPA